MKKLFKAKKKIYYYSDPLNDEMLSQKGKEVKVDRNFKFISKNPIWKVFSFLVYRLILTPFAFIHCKIKFGFKIFGKEKLRKHKKEGYFVYSNHVLAGGDAFFPSIINFPKKPYIVVNAKNLKTLGSKSLIMMLGAIPIPNGFDGMIEFKKAIKKRFEQKNTIVIYPEAHLWPYYTKIRPFLSTSFKFPAELGSPVYCTTTTFKRRKHWKTPKVQIFVDGPFYPDPKLSIKENQQKLRDEVYETMLERSKNSTYEVIKYEQRNN